MTVPSTQIMTHSGGTVPRQRERRFQTDMADPAELHA